METVRRISPLVRSAANYDTSLQVIGHVAGSGIKSKSGIMVGLGETPREVETIMDDLLAVGCQILTIGQYLQPTHRHYPVAEYVTPQQFAAYKNNRIRERIQHCRKRLLSARPIMQRNTYDRKQNTFPICFIGKTGK